MFIVQSQRCPCSTSFLEFLGSSIAKQHVGLCFRLSAVSFSSPTGESFLPAKYCSRSHNEAERHPQGRIQPVHESGEGDPDPCAPAGH